MTSLHRLLVLALVGPLTGAVAQPGPPPPASMPKSTAAMGTILGRNVFDSAGDNVGRLVDILADKNGAPLAAVVDVGGFLGIGARRVAIAWTLLRFTVANGEMRIAMDLTFDSAAAAPEFQGPNNTFIVIERLP